MHNENFNDSLGAVCEELEKNEKLKFVFTSREKLKSLSGALSFFLVDSRRLAKAKTIFLNDNFLPMAFMKIGPGVKVIQLWHGEGAFKKFGFAIDQPEDVRALEERSNSRLTHVVTTSEGVREIYAEAFGVEKEKVFPLGSPRTDFFFKKENLEKARAKLETEYPYLKGKKAVLYAPTFRGDEKADGAILSHFDFERFERELGNEFALAVRLHPQIHGASKIPGGVADLTEYPSVQELIAAFDVLVTDYSSICMSFSLLEKPSIFYAYDLENYKGSRDFYFDFEDYVPGPVAKTADELFEALRKPLDRKRNKRFRDFNFDFFDGKNAERVAGLIDGRGKKA